MVTNRGTAAVTVSTTGTDTINGAASISIPANPGALPYSVLIVASSTGFNTFAGAPTLIPISGGGTGADNAPDALTNLGASTLGANIFAAPTAAAVLGLLGISKSAFTEATVSTNQSLTASAANTAFVCISPITVNLPDSTLVDNQFLIAIFAQGGDVTLSPVGSDRINDETAGTNYVIPQNGSALIVTDGDGYWWLFFLNYPGIAWTTAGGTADAITADFVPPHVALTDGMIVGIRAIHANATTTPTLRVDGTAGYTIVKNNAAAVVANDIPGAGFEALFRLDLPNTRWELMNPATAWLDAFSTDRGATLFRGEDYWEALPPGTDGQILQQYVDDTDPTIKYPQWVNPIIQELDRKTITANGSYLFTDDITVDTVFRITGVAGGGGGGGSSGGGNGNGTPGGGSGGYASILVKGFTAGQSAVITIGAGGTGGTTGGSAGTNGGSTIFAYNSVNVLTLGGGVGGPSNSGGSGPVAGGANGTVGLNTAGLTLIDAIIAGASPGGEGGYLGNSISASGVGGGSPLGIGGTALYGVNAIQNGVGGSLYGSGGGGGATTSGGGLTGGLGANGVIIIERLTR